MPIYFVATVTISDPVRFGNYAKAIASAEYRSGAALRTGAGEVKMRLLIDPA